VPRVSPTAGSPLSQVCEVRWRTYYFGRWNKY